MRMWRNYNPHALLVRKWNCAALLKRSMAVLQKVTHRVSVWPSVPFLGIHPRVLKTYVHTKTRTPVFAVALFIIVKSGNDPNVHQLMVKQCSVSILWNTIRQYKGLKLWKMLQHRWTLKTLWSVKEVRQRDHILYDSIYMKYPQKAKL